MRGLTTLRVRSLGASSVLTAASNVLLGTGSWTTFTPVLTATTASPSLGTNTTTFLGEAHTTYAAYMKLGNVVAVRYCFAFGAGASAGAGMYLINFPTPLPCVLDFNPADWTDNFTAWWPIIGEGKIYDSVNDKIIYVQCWASGAANASLLKFAMRTVEASEGNNAFLIEGNPGIPGQPCNFGPNSFIELYLFYPTHGYGGMMPL